MAKPKAEAATVGSVVLEALDGTYTDAHPDPGYDAKDYRIRVAGAHYDHVGEAPDGRWIYRKH